MDPQLDRYIKIEKGISGGFSELNIVAKRKWDSFDIYSSAIANELKQKLHLTDIRFTQ